MIVSLALIIVSTAQPRLADEVKISLTDITSPVVSLVSAPFMQISSFANGLNNFMAMQQQNENLRQENIKLRQWYHQALYLQSENEALRSLLNLQVDDKLSFISGHIIADAGAAFVKSVLVSAGKSDGVKKGNAVVTGDGLIGRVESTGENVSRVLLINDVNSRVPVLVSGSHHNAVLKGMNDEFPVLTYLPEDVDIKVGSEILTSGLGGIFPTGIPIGKVVMKDNKHLAVQPYADFDQMVYVRILQRPIDPNLILGDSL